MILRRINELKNVGLFFNAKTGFEIGRNALIFGPNGYGKSTLTSMFRSMARNEPDIFSSKKTLHKTGNPSCRLAVSDLEGGPMSNIAFTNGAWDTTALPVVAVFDAKYVADNIYSAFTITREQRERISAIILGNEGVQIAEKIGELRKKVNDTKQSKLTTEEKITAVVPRETPLSPRMTLNEFIAIPESEQIFISEKAELTRQLSNLGKIALIQALADAKEISVPDLTTALLRLSEHLRARLPGISTEVTQRMRERIGQLHDSGGAEGWLRTGAHYLIQDSAKCPFCLQDRSGVEGLFADYEAFFSAAYKVFVETVTSGCSQARDTIRSTFTALESMEEAVAANDGRLKSLVEFLKDEDARRLEEMLSTSGSRVGILASELLAHKEDILSAATTNVKGKISSPLDVFSFEQKVTNDCSVAYSEFSAALLVYNEAVAAVSAAVQWVKSRRYDPLAKETVQKGLEKIELLEARFSPPIIELIVKLGAEVQEIDRIEKEIKIEDKKLEDHNKKITSEYLTRVNSLLAGFGAKFIVRVPDGLQKRGHAPVLDFSYNLFGIEVSSTKFGDVFSDSEKRLLAFCFFIAQIEQLPGLDKAIIVIDDPFSSFDDESMLKLVGHIGTIAAKAGQTIVLSHYSRPLLAFMDGATSWTQMEIVHDQTDGSSFIQTDYKNRFRDGHAHRLDILSGYIASAIPSDRVSSAIQDARRVLEHEIRVRHRLLLQPAVAAGKRMVGEMIDELECLAVTEKSLFKLSTSFPDSAAVIAELRRINAQTRGEHHSDTEGTSVEPTEGEARSILVDLFKVIYEAL